MSFSFLNLCGLSLNASFLGFCVRFCLVLKQALKALQGLFLTQKPETFSKHGSQIMLIFCSKHPLYFILFSQSRGLQSSRMALPVLAALLSLALSGIALLSPLLSHWPLRPWKSLQAPPQGLAVHSSWATFTPGDSMVCFLISDVPFPAKSSLMTLFEIRNPLPYYFWPTFPALFPAEHFSDVHIFPVYFVCCWSLQLKYKLHDAGISTCW